jgi:hypothetical protein
MPILKINIARIGFASFRLISETTIYAQLLLIYINGKYELALYFS